MITVLYVLLHFCSALDNDNISTEGDVDIGLVFGCLLTILFLCLINRWFPDSSKEFSFKRPKSLYGASATSIKGRREYMEDTYWCEKFTSNIHFYSVLDGHGGMRAAAYCQTTLPQIINERLGKVKVFD